ncbi:MAG TPA: ABC transporter substrate-binding protein [Dehalococcoidia bacterium]
MVLTFGGASLATGLLAACGPDDGGSSSHAKDGPLARPQDTTALARRDGILRDRSFAEPPSLDVSASLAPLNTVAPMVYSSLLQTKPGHLQPAQSEVMGDIAESWEWSGDGLQLTMKLRQGVFWHDKAPVNGRALDMDDVLFSWNRFASKGAMRSRLVNIANPAAPVVSAVASDPRTLVLKLKEPLVYTTDLLASNDSGGMLIVPKETDTDFNSRNEMIGTGPFMLSSYTPSVAFTLKRNPRYYDQKYALVSQVELRSSLNTRLPWPSSRRPTSTTSAATCGRGPSTRRMCFL